MRDRQDQTEADGEIPESRLAEQSDADGISFAPQEILEKLRVEILEKYARAFAELKDK